MKVAIFGASGQTGLFLVEHALFQGHTVTAFVRTPQIFPMRHDDLSVVEGDVRSRDKVAEAIEGADAVLCVIGTRLRDAPPRICSAATENIIAGMKQHGVRRLITVTGAGSGDSKQRTGFFERAVMKVFVSLDDKERQEDLIKESGLDWVIVRPPLLTNDPHTGEYKVGPDVRPGIAGKLARADLVDFMLEQLISDDYLHQTPTICY